MDVPPSQAASETEGVMKTALRDAERGRSCGKSKEGASDWTGVRDIKGGATLDEVIESGVGCLDVEVRDESNDCVTELEGLRGMGGDVGRALVVGSAVLVVVVMFAYGVTEGAGGLNVDLNLDINEDIIEVSPSSSSLNGFALYKDVTSSREPRECEDCTEPSPRATSITMTAGGKMQNARVRAQTRLTRRVQSRFASRLHRAWLRGKALE